METPAAKHSRPPSSEPSHLHSHTFISYVIFLRVKVRTTGLELGHVSEMMEFCLLQMSVLVNLYSKDSHDNGER